MNDPIVDEVRAIRDAHAARFNYDLDAIFRDIKEQERLSGRTLVSYARDASEPVEVPQATAPVTPVTGESGRTSPTPAV